jgi:hypothetical protein
MQMMTEVSSNQLATAALRLRNCQEQRRPTMMPFSLISPEKQA